MTWRSTVTNPEEKSMKTPRIQGNSLTAFFALTLLLSMPLYVLGAIAFWGVLGTPTLGPVYLALLTFTPATAVVIFSTARHDEVQRPQESD